MTQPTGGALKTVLKTRFNLFDMYTTSFRILLVNYVEA
jgi:hypothetical protein